MTTGNPVEAIRRAYRNNTIDWGTAYSQLISLGFDDDEAQQQLSRWTVAANAREPIAKPTAAKTVLPTVPPASGFTWTPGEFEQAYPDVAWRRSYGLPAYGRNPFQEWLNAQSSPAFASHIASQYRSPLATPAAFDPMAQNWGADALSALRGMRGVEGPEQEQWMSEIGAPRGAGGAGENALYYLLAAALGKQGGIGYASPIARRKAGRIAPLGEKWQQETQAGATGPTLLDYLLTQLGITG